MNEPIRVMLAGVRRRGTAYLKSVAADPRFEAVALVGRYPDQLDDTRARTSLERTNTFTSLASETAGVTRLSHRRDSPRRSRRFHHRAKFHLISKLKGRLT
jgi:hypothetical protein